MSGHCTCASAWCAICHPNVAWSTAAICLSCADYRARNERLVSERDRLRSALRDVLARNVLPPAVQDSLEELVRAS